jgi:predicted N-formylglutamate amidohydrolase
MLNNQHCEDENAVEVINRDGAGGVLLICEHASSHIPARYGDLGLRPEWRHSHAAWDPGALALSRALSAALDAPVVASRVSRLVYDCNRPPEAESAMPERSELVEVPGNTGLTQAQRDERTETIYRPFCTAVTDMIATGPRALITVHSFTPVFFGVQRQTEIGILHDSDSRLADGMLEHAADLPHRVIERNQPYGPEDGVTHSLKLHGIAHGVPNVMLEIRNDLLRDQEDVERMSQELLTMIRPALETLSNAGEGGHDA